MQCTLCDKPATGAIKPDLDLTGIGYCDEHKMEISVVYLQMIQGDTGAFDRMLKRYKRKNKADEKAKKVQSK